MTGTCRLQPFCNPNARSAIGFVGTPWETGPWSSIEIASSRPGIGRLIFGAIADRDPAVIAGSVLFVTFFFVLANLLVDLSYALVDPRVRLGH